MIQANREMQQLRCSATTADELRSELERLCAENTMLKAAAYAETQRLIHQLDEERERGRQLRAELLALKLTAGSGEQRNSALDPMSCFSSCDESVSSAAEEEQQEETCSAVESQMWLEDNGLQLPSSSATCIHESGPAAQASGVGAAVVSHPLPAASTSSTESNVWALQNGKWMKISHPFLPLPPATAFNPVIAGLGALRPGRRI